MEIFIGKYWNEYTDEWQIDEDAIFLKEADAVAWVEEGQAKAYQRLVADRNKRERENYERNLQRYREDKALRAAGIRTGGNPLAEPKEPITFTEPQWKPGTLYTYERYEAK